MLCSWRRTSKEQLWISEQIISVVGREVLPQSPSVGKRVRQDWITGDSS